MSDSEKLELYRYILKESPLIKSNPLSLPVKPINKGGSGPNTKILVYIDNRDPARVENYLTENNPSISLIVLDNNETISIITSSHGMNLKKKPTFSIESLLFPCYHTILAIIHELTIIHSLPLEWASYWVASNREKIDVIDGFVSLIDNKRPKSLNTIESILIGLEGHNITCFKNNSSPKPISIVSGKIYDGEPNILDVTPLPTLLIKRIEDKYKVISKEIESSIINEEKEGKILNLPSLILLLEKLLERKYIFYPFLSISPKEYNRIKIT